MGDTSDQTKGEEVQQNTWWGMGTSCFEHVAVIFAGRRGVKWKRWSGIFVLPPVSSMLWLKQQHAFAMEAYFFNGRLVIVVQCAFCRFLDIPPQGRASDQKCVSMWMDAF
ncbi:hypothetical protein TNCV_764201 [Trichonephila clavipes]|nr:hypothetical protein TNCV_764201 [Trichonephila clavipes]